MRAQTLKGQIFLFATLALSLVLAIIFMAYFSSKLLQRQQAMVAAEDRMIISSREQISALLPALLVTEEYGSVQLQLQKIKQMEGLNTVTLVDESNLNKGNCDINDNIMKCSDLMSSYVRTATAISLPDETKIYLVKDITVPEDASESRMFYLLFSLFCFVAFVFIGFVLLILGFIESHLRQPLLNLGKNISAASDLSDKFEDFQYEEVRDLGHHIQSLLQDLQNEKVAAYAGKLAAQVAHDIRSPLSVLNLALANSGISEERRSLVEEASRKIQQIAGDLLLSLKGKPADYENKGFPLIKATKLALQQKRIEYINQPIVLTEGLWPRELIVCGNENEFSRIFSNLINNAYESLPAGHGEVQIKVSVTDKEAIVQIKDTGCGIPDHIMNRIGDEGFSYGKAVSPRSGFGLGVYSAKKVIKDWGGALFFESKLNCGTTVFIRLPLEQTRLEAMLC